MKLSHALSNRVLDRLAHLMVVIAFGFGTLPNSSAAFLAQAGPPTLVIQAPAQVEAGAPILLSVQVVNAVDLAGYEMAVLFDTNAAEFAGVQQRQNSLHQSGRDVGPLTAVDLSAGVSIGLFSCPVPDCVTGQGLRKNVGGQGTLQLATLTLIANLPGMLEIKFDAIKFVDAAGQPVNVDLPQTSVSVQVGAAGGPAYAAPNSMWSLQAAALDATVQSVPGPFDLSGDGQVGHADAMEVALEWTLLRQHQQACGALPDPTRDVNHDGCLDVADLQMLAAHYGPVTTSGLPYQVYLPLVVGGGEDRLAAPTATTQTWTVNTTSDQGDGNIGNGVCRNAAGACSLRAAIQEANARSGPDTITFNIPGEGVQTIVLNGKLPTLTDSNTTIDGYTQPGAMPNTDPLADNADIRIQIQGAGNSSFDAFVITSAGNTIRGLAIYEVQRSFWIYGSGATNNTIVGCFVGTNAAGTDAAPGLAAYAHGFHIEQGASNNVIGRPALADRNVISGNARHGLGIWHENSTGNIVQNNIIGLNPSGTDKLPNRKHGLDINFGSSQNVFGGNGPYEHNVTSGNDDSGLEVSHTAQTTQNQILGNYIGTNLAGTNSPSWAHNGGRGILIEDGATNNTFDGNVIGTNDRGAIEIFDSYTFGNQISNNRIGISLDGSPMPSDFGLWVKGSGLMVGPGNIIAYNTNAGLKIEGDLADNNTITQNSFFNNGGMGIDVFPRGVNQIGQYPPTGPNQGQNFPELQSATPTYVTGSACGGCTVEIFIADSGAGAYGEGQTFVGGGTAGGDGSFTIAIAGANEGQYLTSTATDGAGNTSEFSLNIEVTAGGGPTPTPGPTPTSGPSTYVSDTFTRNVTDGWGGPDTGGTYTLLHGATANQAFEVNGSQGKITLNNAGLGREALLLGVNQLSIDISFSVSTNKVSIGDSQELLFIGRRVTDGTMYRGRLRFYETGEVYVQAVKGVSGSWSTLGPLVLVPGVSHAPGQVLLVHAQIVGADPTTIRMNVWPEGSAEPAGWQYSINDSTAALQTSGAVGLRALLGASATNAPVVFTLDNYLVTSVP